MKNLLIRLHYVSWRHNIILPNLITKNRNEEINMSKIALVVEDNEDLSDICSIALQEAGFETHVVFTGESALAWLSDTKPDLVILDINLPGMNGVGVLKNIRADDRMIDTKIIITTADPYYVNELGDKADLVLIKPVLFTQLLNVVKGLKW